MEANASTAKNHANLACSSNGTTAPLASVDELRANLARLQDELIAQQRLAMLGTMSAMVAHEFNNLLTPVVARAQDALDRDDVPAMRKALDRTLVQAQKAITITQHLLGLARDSDEQPRVCNVAAAVQEAVESATRPFDKDAIELRVNVSPDLNVRARPVWLEQVLLNLLLNARAAMQSRGGVLSISAHRDGRHIAIDVCDSGTGFPPGQLENVLNPFLASDPKQQPCDWQAIGLGLNVCRTITRQHDATIQASTNDGPGCTFHLRWPAA